MRDLKLAAAAESQAAGQRVVLGNGRCGWVASASTAEMFPAALMRGETTSDLHV
jgi:hypothetical protein